MNESQILNSEEFANIRTPTFGFGTVPMSVATKVLGMKSKTIIDDMQAGLLDIGYVRVSPKKRGKREYRKAEIIPKKFYELTGYIWQGEVNGKEEA